MVLIGSSLFFSQPTFAEPAPFDVYGGEIGFDVVRDGDLVGQHVTKFSHEESGMIIESRMNMSIAFLSVPVYTFDYRSVEIWLGGALSYLDVVIVDGSDHIKISSLPNPDGLTVNTPSGTYSVNSPIISTNHWNVNVVKQSRVLNTLTGNINQVKISNRGEERIAVKGSFILATRYDYSGELTDTSVWYDANGRWSKLKFKARDGSTVEYICNTCGNDP
jgi:hypothetical protein